VGAVLSGTVTVQAVGGVSAFLDLSIDLAGVGYSLTAATAGLAQDISAEFDVIAAGSNRLSLSTQVVDENSNPVSQAGIQITAEVETGPGGAILGGGTATTDAFGQATFSGLVLTGATGSYTLRFGATGLFPVSSNSITLDLGDADPTLTTAVVPGGLAGVATSMAIQARDAGNNDLTSGGATVAVSVAAGPNADSTVTVVDNGDGTYSATYTPTIVGTDEFSITLDGTGIGGGPYNSVVVPGPGSAAQTTATVPEGTAGFVTLIDIQARDDFSNALIASGGIVAVTVTTGPNAGATVTVVDNGDGTYQASYTPQLAGTDNFEISLNSVVIGGGPYSSVVTASDASPAQTTATVPATGTAGIVTTIVVQTRDVNGNDLTSGGETIGVVVAGANALAAVNIVDNDDGTYTATYTPTTAGTDDVNITLGQRCIWQQLDNGRFGGGSDRDRCKCRCGCHGRGQPGRNLHGYLYASCYRHGQHSHHTRRGGNRRKSIYQRCHRRWPRAAGLPGRAE
jgi:adhesin/invasin